MHEATRGITYTPTFAIYKRGRKASGGWGGACRGAAFASFLRDEQAAGAGPGQPTSFPRRRGCSTGASCGADLPAHRGSDAVPHPGTGGPVLRGKRPAAAGSCLAAEPGRVGREHIARRGALPGTTQPLRIQDALYDFA